MKFTSFIVTMHRLVVHVKQWSCFVVKLRNSLLWPPNSPDLNPVDYRIWGVMQERVYHTPVM